MEFKDAVSVFTTRSPVERFETLLGFLRPLRNQLAALKSLDNIGTAPTSPAAAEPAADSSTDEAEDAATTTTTTTDSSSPSSDGSDDAVGAGQGVEIVQSEDAAEAASAEGRSNIESVLSPGMRIEYWYNEDYGWIEGELVKAERIAGEVVWWAVKFPVDGTTENLKLNMDTKARWRLKRSSG